MSPWTCGRGIRIAATFGSSVPTPYGGAPDLLVGVRGAITELQTIRIQPSFVAVNPRDLENAQLKRKSSGAFDWHVDGARVEPAAPGLGDQAHPDPRGAVEDGVGHR